MSDIRVALISATPAAIGPAVAGFHAEFPEAEPWNLLDDKLLGDADAQGGLTPALAERMRRLIDHAVAGGARGILLTCSLYGPVAAEVDTPIPVLAPDEAAFAEALGGQYRRLLVVGSFASAVRDSVDRLAAAARAAGAGVQLDGVVAAGAFDAVTANDPAALLSALRAACQPMAKHTQAIVLAQYSLAPAADELAATYGLPVISGPRSAARTLRSMIASGSR